MRVLLDTHALLWLVTDDPRLSDRARDIFIEPVNEMLVSGVTGFEIAVKYALGKLELAEPPGQFMDARMRNNALVELPVAIAHTYPLATLPRHHRDPFDRLLIAQAMTEQVPILTADRAFAPYPVSVLW